MGIDSSFPVAFAKSQIAAGTALPTEGSVFISVRDGDKDHILDPARRLMAMGFTLLATGGTHDYLAAQGVAAARLHKISEGRPNAIDLIKNRQVALIIITPSRKGIKTDEGLLRASAVRFNIPMITTTTGAAAAVQAIAALRAGPWGVRALQDFFPAGSFAIDAHPPKVLA
jgi:carbamoyl-phosphate synthase large subunit